MSETGIGAAVARKEDLRFITAITNAVGHEDVPMPATPQAVWRAAQKAAVLQAAE